MLLHENSRYNSEKLKMQSSCSYAKMTKINYIHFVFFATDYVSQWSEKVGVQSLVGASPFSHSPLSFPSSPPFPLPLEVSPILLLEVWGSA